MLFKRYCSIILLVIMVVMLPCFIQKRGESVVKIKIMTMFYGQVDRVIRVLNPMRTPNLRIFLLPLFWQLQ